MNAIETLISVLCGPDDKCCISSSDDDRHLIDSALAELAQATVAQAVVQDDLITIRKPTTSAEMLWLLKLAHLVISDVGKTLEESFAPAQPVAEPAKSAARKQGEKQ